MTTFSEIRKHFFEQEKIDYDQEYENFEMLMMKKMKKENIIQEFRHRWDGRYRITPSSASSRDGTWRDNTEYMRFLVENWNEERVFWVKVNTASVPRTSRKGYHVTAQICDKTLIL